VRGDIERGDDPTERPIIVVSVGRSGSTLVQRLLNAHPLITVWGEHGGFLTHLAAAHSRVVSNETIRGNIQRGFKQRRVVIGELREPSLFIPWVSPFEPETLEAEIRRLIIRLFSKGLPPGTRWGFKEIRYSAKELRFLNTLFPAAQHVITVRSLRGFLRSRMRTSWSPQLELSTAEGRETALLRITELSKEWFTRNADLARFAADAPWQTLLLGFDELPEMDTVVRLFAFLGESLPSRVLLEEILQARAGSSDDAVSRQGAEEWSASLLQLIDEALEQNDLQGRLDGLLSTRFGIDPGSLVT